MRRTRPVLLAAFGLAAALGAAPLTAATAAPAAAPAPAAHSASSGYASFAPPSDLKVTKNASALKAEIASNQAFFKAVWKAVAAERAKNPGAQAVTVTYTTNRAPSFRTQIARSTQIWNSSVTNVKLQEGTSGSFYYREGNDPRGSYASTDGHGRGYIFLDYRQNQQYNSTRVTAHETGHVLGLPDHYSGPCSELMSGGGPGPSCQNATPNAQERARVDQLWRNGLAAAQASKS